MSNGAPKPARHLKKDGKAFWREIAASYDLEAHHRQLLLRACEFLDTIAEARTSLKAAGGHYFFG